MRIPSHWLHWVLSRLVGRAGGTANLELLCATAIHMKPFSGNALTIVTRTGPARTTSSGQDLSREMSPLISVATATGVSLSLAPLNGHLALDSLWSAARGSRQCLPLLGHCAIPSGRVYVEYGGNAKGSHRAVNNAGHEVPRSASRRKGSNSRSWQPP